MAKGGGGKGLATKKKIPFFEDPKKVPKNIVATKLEGGEEGLSDRATKKIPFLRLSLL